MTDKHTKSSRQRQQTLAKKARKAARRAKRAPWRRPSPVASKKSTRRFSLSALASLAVGKGLTVGFAVITAFSLFVTSSLFAATKTDITSPAALTDLKTSAMQSQVIDQKFAAPTQAELKHVEDRIREIEAYTAAHKIRAETGHNDENPFSVVAQRIMNEQSQSLTEHLDAVSNDVSAMFEGTKRPASHATNAPRLTLHPLDIQHSAKELLKRAKIKKTPEARPIRVRYVFYTVQADKGLSL